MRRVLLLCALFLAAAPAAAADAASVKLLECAPALESQDRTATFEARVRALRASERMQVRFTLQVRDEGLTAFRRVVADGLDEWLTSAAGVSRYSYAKTVQNLSAPAAYRMIVRFRWLAADGSVLARSRATSRLCRQPDMRPDLAVSSIELVPWPAPERWYLVTVRNAGRSAADTFAVALRVGDLELAPLAVAGLSPGERWVLPFIAPPCAVGTPLVATVDPDGAVDERGEDDNVLAATCGP